MATRSLRSRRRVVTALYVRVFVTFTAKALSPCGRPR
jgi:hypothetical protein